MMNRNFIFFLRFFFLALTITLQSCKDDDPSPESEYANLEEEINALADKYVKVGAIVGIIDKDQKEHIYSYGKKGIEISDPPDSNTVFDIGSVTKTFTAVLAAEMYIEGDIQDDIVGHYLPDSVIMPSKDEVEITFVHLLTHTSGIPRTPHEEGSDFPLPPGYDIENPYAAYTTEQLYDYLTNYCKLEFTPGTWWEYSNTGAGLVGHVLGIIDGTSYQTILKRDVFDVLGMSNSSLFLSDHQKLNMALGHDTKNKIVPFYTANDIFQGCGMIKSSLNDMFKYLKANMGLVNTPLHDAMELTHQKVMHQGSMGDQGLAWWILDLDDGQKIIYSGGNTNGHSAYIAFNKSKFTGAIILFNSSNHDGANLNMGEEVMKAILKY